MSWEQVFPYQYQRDHQSRVQAPKLTKKQAMEIANQEPVYIDDIVGPGSVLARHVQRFTNGRHQRIKKIQNMGVAAQNAYYRSLGYF